LIDTALGSDLPTMAVDDPPNGRKSNSSAFKLFREMQALKHPEQFIYILHVEAGAIIPHEHLDFIFPIYRANLDFGLGAHAREFDRVGEKVADHQPQHRTVAITDRKGMDLPDNVSPPRVQPDLRDALLDELVQARQRLFGLGPPDPGKRQQIVDRVAILFDDSRIVCVYRLFSSSKEDACLCSSSEYPTTWRSGARRSWETE